MKIVIYLGIILSIMVFNVQSLAIENTTFSDNDIRTIQNDSIVPRKIISNSDELFKLNEGIFEGNQTQNSPIIILRNMSLGLFGIFVIIQIIMVLITKITIHELAGNFVKALVMNVAVLTILLVGIGLTNSFTMLFKLDKNLTVNTVRSMQLYVTSKEDRDKIINMSDNEVLQNNFNPPPLTYSGLTGDIFCLKTIQDQYRVANLVLNWVTVVLTYFNWLILLVADIVIKTCLFLSPFIGYLYIFGDKFSIITKFWTAFLDSALAKSLFYIVYGIINVITNLITPNLTNNIINLEFAFYTIASLIALSITTFTFREVFRFDGAIKIFSDKINTLQTKL